MNNLIRAIGIITSITVMLICAYLAGTAKAYETNVIPDTYIDTKSTEFVDNYIDMRNVCGFSVNENGLQLYFNDGTGYYWEK